MKGIIEDIRQFARDHPAAPIVADLSAVNNHRVYAQGCVHDAHEAYDAYHQLNGIDRAVFDDHMAVHKRMLQQHWPDELAKMARIETTIALPWAYQALEPTFLDFDTPTLRRQMHAKADIGAQINKLADVIDCFCYSFHEIMAGNRRFATRQRWVHHDRIFYLPNPCQDCQEFFFPGLAERLPLVAPLLGQIPPLLCPPEPLKAADYITLARYGRPHTPASIKRSILSRQYPLYAKWLEVLVESDLSAMDWLTTINRR